MCGTDLITHSFSKHGTTLEQLLTWLLSWGLGDSPILELTFGEESCHSAFVYEITFAQYLCPCVSEVRREHQRGSYAQPRTTPEAIARVCRLARPSGKATNLRLVLDEPADGAQPLRSG